jgi:hypothetical protein
MENFFTGETFCTDLESLMYLLDIDEDKINSLPDDWTYKVEEADLEPMYKLDADSISDLLCSAHNDRYDEDGTQYDKVTKALQETVDFEKLNSMIPKLWYPNSKFITITKQDLIKYVS